VSAPAPSPTSPCYGEPPQAPTTDILGLKVSRVTRAETRELLHRFLQSRKPHLVVTADAAAHVLASQDPELLEIINHAALCTPDGTGLIWASRFLKTPLPERVSGVDLAEMLCADSARMGFGIYFYGAAPGVAEEAAEAMRRRYPGTWIVGVSHGFQRTPEEQAAVVRDIQEKQPDVLLVALGMPRQEKWIVRHMAELQTPLAMGVGGSFDVFSGRVNRAPEWMQKRGLEWLYRLMQDPSKYAKVANLPRFAWRVLQRRRIGPGPADR